MYRRHAQVTTTEAVVETTGTATSGATNDVTIGAGTTGAMIGAMTARTTRLKIAAPTTIAEAMTTAAPTTIAADRKVTLR